jgi:CheY-like chemotaxis protein/HPt (histidine-containing phosphotransfer) domain-containing protein
MKPRILLVEDDPICQDLAKGILNAAGFETDVAPDGFSALRLLREQAHAVVIVDYHLPEMDGYALAKLLREVVVKGSAPFSLVALTADLEGLAARKEAHALFEATLAKPYDPHRLVEMVRKLLPADDRRIRDVRDAANALLAEPGIDRARAAARAFWRARNLDDVPRAFAIPEPTGDQAANLGICFDLVGWKDAELLILLNAGGIEMLSQIRELAGRQLPPVLTLDKSLTLVSDIFFNLSDPDSWSEVAERLGSFGRTVTIAGKTRETPAGADKGVHHDLQLFRRMTALIGNERSVAILARFSQILESSFNVDDNDQVDRQLLLEQTRATASAAAMLGFSRLVETCEELEAAIYAGKELERTLDKVRAAKLRSLRTLAQLSAAEGHSAAANQQG